MTIQRTGLQIAVSFLCSMLTLYSSFISMVQFFIVTNHTFLRLALFICWTIGFVSEDFDLAVFCLWSFVLGVVFYVQDFIFEVYWHWNWYVVFGLIEFMFYVVFGLIIFWIGILTHCCLLDSMWSFWISWAYGLIWTSSRYIVVCSLSELKRKIYKRTSVSVLKLIIWNYLGNVHQFRRLINVSTFMVF